MNLFENTIKPLADRIRPTKLDEVIGQEHLLADNQFLRQVIEQGQPTSMILWGPPGTGKTTLARIIAASSKSAFMEISAVTSGLADVKKVIEEAKKRQSIGQKTVLFVDEIHRFNKAQQDAFLPHVENGTIILIGATTENPSFEVIGPLLSRSRVVTLQALTAAQVEQVISRAMQELSGKTIDKEATALLAQLAAGDARVALNGLETAASLTDKIGVEDIKQAMQKVGLKYDKTGEYHYNLISAFIKSMRGSATDAALFYLGRMLESGEDPKFIARRMVVFASEDIGIAHNDALALAVATFQAVERIGMPECAINLSHCVVALCQSPKSRASYDAYGRALQAVRQHPEAEVPLHLRNAPTKLMKELDYGKDYKWKADFKHPQGFLPKELENERFYRENG